MARGPIRPKVKKGKKGQLRLKGISGIALKPTEQQIKIAEGLAKGLSKKDALLAAGISEKNARSNSAELTAEPGVVKALDEAFDRVGISIDRIAEVIQEGFEATRPVVIKNKIEEYPDYSERRQSARLASELKGLFPEKGTGREVDVRLKFSFGANSDGNSN